MIEVVLAERRGDPERLGRGRLVLEPTGVGHEPGVQTDRGVVVHAAAHRLDQPEDHLARRRRGRVDQRHVPSPSFDRWWSIQITSPAFAAAWPSEHEPVEGRAVARHHHRRRLRERLRRNEPVRTRGATRPSGALRAARSGTSTTVRMPRASQEVREAEHRAERVGVGVHVARERHLVGARRGSRPPARSPVRSPRRPPGAGRRSGASIRSPCSYEVSSSNSSSGRYFMRIWRPSARRRCGRAERSAARVAGALLVVAQARVRDPCMMEVG